MKQISVQAFKEVIEAESQNKTIDFINVCTPAEFAESHIPGVRNVPLNEIEAHRSEFTDKQTIYVHCRSGKRGAAAVAKLSALGITAELINVEGGQMAWTEAGLPVRKTSNRLPIMRQVLLTAGLLILGFVVAGYVVSPLFFLGAGVIGVGLSVAGATGWCGMSYVLAAMPWNK